MDTTRSNYRAYLLFLASGISGLMYQVVWLRMLSRLLGATIYATSTVRAAFMGGLALGSFFIGRLITLGVAHVESGGGRRGCW